MVRRLPSLFAGVALAFSSWDRAEAHIVGTYADFLAGIEDESTLRRLEEQMDATANEIGELAPRVDALETEYDSRRQASVGLLMFYNSIWLDTYADIVLASDELIDLLAAERLLERKLEADIESVNTLYLSYMQLKATHDALVGHRSVLQMIESNFEARSELLDRYAGMPADRLSRIVAAIWENSAAAYVDEYLIADAKVISRNPEAFFTRHTDRSAFLLSQEALNAIGTEELVEAPEDGTTGQQISGKLTYNIRPDHVYVHYVNDDKSGERVDLILIGQVDVVGVRNIGLVFEAGYMNGIVLPAPYFEPLGGFTLDYRTLMPNSVGFSVEQTNGAILIQPLEGAGE